MFLSETTATVPTLEKEAELRQMSQAQSLPAGGVLKARTILMLTEGCTYLRIQVQTTAPIVSRGKQRLLIKRIAGLIEARHRWQKPSVITPQEQARVLEATRRKAENGSTHWSCRKLAVSRA